MTATTKKGLTPLHLAAKYGRLKIATLLLQKGAPVDAQGKVIELLKKKKIGVGCCVLCARVHFLSSKLISEWRDSVTCGQPLRSSRHRAVVIGQRSVAARGSQKRTHSFARRGEKEPSTRRGFISSIFIDSFSAFEITG